MEKLNNTSTSLLPDSYLADEMYVTYFVLKFIIGTIIIIFNTSVITLYLWKRRRLFCVPSNRLLLSLLACELLTGLTVILSALCNENPNCRNPKTKVVVTYRILLDVLTSFIVKTVVLHICGLTLDRYLSIFYALKYKSLVTTKAVVYYIMMSWGFSLFLSVLQFLWLQSVLSGNHSKDNMMKISNIEIWYSVVTFIVFLAIPIILIAAAYLAMIIEIRRLFLSVPRHHYEKVESAKQRRLIYVFCVMYLTFFLFVMPYFTLRLWIDINFWIGYKVQFDRVIIHFVILIRYLTSFVNPVIYAKTSPELRSIVRCLFRKLQSNFQNYYGELRHRPSIESETLPLRTLTSTHSRYQERLNSAKVDGISWLKSLDRTT